MTTTHSDTPHIHTTHSEEIQPGYTKCGVWVCFCIGNRLGGNRVLLGSLRDKACFCLFCLLLLQVDPFSFLGLFGFRCSSLTRLDLNSSLEVRGRKGLDWTGDLIWICAHRLVGNEKLLVRGQTAAAVFFIGGTSKLIGRIPAQLMQSL
jgi:hypothetical protein